MWTVSLLLTFLHISVSVITWNLIPVLEDLCYWWINRMLLEKIKCFKWNKMLSFLTTISASSYGLLEVSYVTYIHNTCRLSVRLRMVRRHMGGHINNKTVVSSPSGCALPHACEKGYVELLGAMPNLSRPYYQAPKVSLLLPVMQLSQVSLHSSLFFYVNPWLCIWSRVFRSESPCFSSCQQCW